MSRKLIIPIIFTAIITIVATTTIYIGGNANSFARQLELGYKFMEDGKYEEAIIAFKRVIRIDPKNGEAYVGLGRAHIASGEDTEAEVAFHMAIELSPLDWEAYLELADIFMQQGDVEKALNLLRSANSSDERIMGKILDYEKMTDSSLNLNLNSDSQNSDATAPLLDIFPITEGIVVKANLEFDPNRAADMLNNSRGVLHFYNPRLKPERIRNYDWSSGMIYDNKNLSPSPQMIEEAVRQLILSNIKTGYIEQNRSENTNFWDRWQNWDPEYQMIHVFYDSKSGAVGYWTGFEVNMNSLEPDGPDYDGAVPFDASAVQMDVRKDQNEYHAFVRLDRSMLPEEARAAVYHARGYPVSGEAFTEGEIQAVLYTYMERSVNEALPPLLSNVPGVEDDWLFLEFGTQLLMLFDESKKLVGYSIIDFKK